MLTVHHLGKSQSERIIWLCEELESPYDLKRCPNIVSYLARIGQRPAYRRAMEKGDPEKALLLA